MVRASARRPLPALAFLLGLTLLTALVWWRVIHRADADRHPKAQGTCPSSAAPTLIPQPAAVSVDVLNSTVSAPKPRNGLAGSVSKTLRGLGFKVVSVGNDDSGTIAGVGEIRYGTNGRAAAKLLSFYLPGAALVPIQRSNAEVDVSLGMKFSKVRTSAQAKKAISAAHVSQAPAKPGRLAATPTKAATATPTPTSGAESPTPTQPAGSSAAC